MPSVHTGVEKLCPVIASNLPFGSDGYQHQRSKAHLPTSAPFRAQPPGWYPAGYPQAPDGGAGHRRPVSCRLSATGIRFLGILFPPGIPLSSRSAYQAAPGPRRGCHVPHIRVTAGLGALFTPRPSGALRPVRSLRPPLAPSPRGQAHHPGSSSHLPELSITRRHRGFTCVHPPGLPPRLWPPDGAGPLGLAPRASHPSRQDLRRTPGQGTGIEHSPGATRPS